VAAARGVPTRFYNFLAFGGARGDGAIRYWVPILLTITVWIVAAVLTPLLLRVIPNRIMWLHASHEEELKRRAEEKAAALVSRRVKAAVQLRAKQSELRHRHSSALLAGLLGSDPDDDANWCVRLTCNPSFVCSRSATLLCFALVVSRCSLPPSLPPARPPAPGSTQKVSTSWCTIHSASTAAALSTHTARTTR
jgi:hypothetical protein